MPRVLVVDDDRAIRELLTFALEGEGYDVRTLSDGTEVVALLEAMREPCVVLMDLMMPRVDGWEVCRRLAVRGDLLERHHVILMTACMLREDERPTVAHTLLRKPFELAAVYRLIASLSVATPPHVSHLPCEPCQGELPIAG